MKKGTLVTVADLSKLNLSGLIDVSKYVEPVGILEHWTSRYPGLVVPNQADVIFPIKAKYKGKSIPYLFTILNKGEKCRFLAQQSLLIEVK